MASGAPAPPRLAKLRHLVPNRAGLPPLERYAKLLGPKPGEERVVGYLEASRGCRYRCRHCPVVPVYDGRFFVVPAEIVLADARGQVEAGAQHLTFGDPDFFNGVGHALRVARALHSELPELSFDATVKVEHVIRYREHFAELAELGFLFIQSAVESLSDRVLVELDKGHTRSDVFEALDILRAAGVALRPSFVPFTPWATLDDTIELVDFLFEQDLLGSIDPIQLTIRLLVPPGSALLWEKQQGPRPAGSAPSGNVRTATPPWLGELAPEQLTYRWVHPDPRMDELAARASQLVEEATAAGRDNVHTLLELRKAAYSLAGREPAPLGNVRARFVPRLTESWFCCAEPSRAQRAQLAAPDCCGSTTSAPELRR